ncbi:MAG: hypothetical protein ACK5FT_06765 [Sphingomonadales bacterium]|jgi:hypothetical protein
MRHILFLSFLVSLGSVFAQPSDSARKAKVEAMKKIRRELYVQKLSLSDEQAQKFFPVMNELEQKQRELKKPFRDKWGTRKPEELSDAEAEVYLTEAHKMREDELKLAKTYGDKLKPIIGAKKVLMLKRIQHEVQVEMVRKFREMRGQERPGGPKGPGGRGGHRPGGKHGPPPPPPDDY